MSRRLTTIACAGLLAACGELDHVSPYDAASPPALQGRATLRGVVTLEAAGATAPSLSGVHVSVSGQSFGADTDADGAYAIAGVPPGSWTVQAVRTGWDDAAVTGVVVTLDDGNHDVAVPALALTLARGTLSGTVALSDTLGGGASGPLSGASVSLSGLPGAVTTDRAGGFLIADVPAGNYTLTASRPGFLDATVQSLQVVPKQVNDAATVSMEWDPGGLRGSLLVQGAADSGGVNVVISGATIVGTAFRATTTSSLDGSWGLVGLVPAGTYNLSFERSDYSVVATAATVAAHTTTDVPAITLTRDTGSVVGTATLAGSSSSAGVQVSLTPLGGATPAAVALTDSSGNWRLDGLPVGTYTIGYSKTPGYEPATGLVTALSHTTVAAAAVVLAVIPGTLRGVCTLEGRANGAWGGTTVRLVGGTLSTQTLADGSWVLSGVGTGPQVVALERTGYEPQEVQVVTAASGDLTLFDVALALSRGTLAGTLVLPGAVSSAGVVVSASGPAAASTVTDASGAFALSGLPVGTYAVAARKDPDWQPLSVTGQVVSAGATTTLTGSPLSLSLAASGSIAGTAAVERGSASGIAVTLSGTDPNGAAVARATSTGSGGAYAFTEIPNGTYALTFTKSGYVAAAVSGVVVVGAAAAPASVTLPVALGDIAGSVALSAGAVPGFSVGTDFSGAVVTLAGADVPVAAAVTDAAGSYRFRGVPVSLTGASFTVTATKAGYQAASTGVLALAGATATVGTILTLPVNAGSLSGTARLWDNVGGAGANATSAGIAIAISGSAFNGTSYQVPVSPSTGADGSWTAAAVPAGSYSVVATSDSRTCGDFPAAVVTEGAATVVGGAVCTDAVAPDPLALGEPVAPDGARPGYTNLALVVVPIATAAGDGTLPASNFRGYQRAVGAAPDWSGAPVIAGQPASLTFSLPTSGGLPVDGSYTLWARAVDWMGNAGPAASTAVVVDATAPPVPTIATARAQVNATSAAVTLAGAEGTANFLQYEACTAASAVACAGSPTCSPVATPPAYSASLTENQRNCIWALARDRAGNASGYAVAEIVSDLQPPVGPTLSPLFDPASLTVHADYADFFVTAPASDGPVGAGAWANVAWVEVNSGSGFTALCPQTACHTNDTYDPCSCGCSDPRLRCRDGVFQAVRVPLLGGVANDVAVRAVDVAGNSGSGAAQMVPVSGLDFHVAASSYDEGMPRVRGQVLVFRGAPTTADGSALRLVQLGANQLYDAADDTWCVIGSEASAATGVSFQPVAEPLSATAVVYGDVPAVQNALRIRRDTGLGLCDGSDTTLRSYGTAYPRFSAVSASLDAGGTRERAAWAETASGGGFTVYVRDGGTNLTLDPNGGTDDVTTPVATVAAGSYPQSLQLAGNALVFGRASSEMAVAASGLTAYVATSPDFATTSSWTLPAGAIVAALDDEGRSLAWFANEAPGPTLRVRTVGSGGTFGDADATEVFRRWSGPTVSAGGLAFRGAHLVLTEGAGTAGGSAIDHWFAGGDGVFGPGDDVFSRVLPNAAGRYFPALGAGLSGGVVYFQSGATRSNGDVLGVDLSALRWEVAGAQAPSRGPVTNRAGTLFYTDGGGTHARTSDGRETTASSAAEPTGTYAADEQYLFFPVGAEVWRHAPASSTGQYFTTGASSRVATLAGSAAVLAAGGGRALVSDGSARWLLEPPATGTTYGQVPLTGKPAGYGSFLGGQGVSASHAAFGCIGPAPGYPRTVCVLEPGADGAYGTADDPSFVLAHPSGTAISTPLAVAVSGHRVAVVANGSGGPHLFVLEAPGTGSLAVAAANSEWDLGPVPDGRLGGIDIAGSMVAWSTDDGSNGQQIFLADAASRTKRKLTSHYAPKPTVAVDPSGRVYWIDQVFPTSAIFVSAP